MSILDIIVLKRLHIDNTDDGVKLIVLTIAQQKPGLVLESGVLQG